MMPSVYFKTPYFPLKITQQDNQLTEIDFVNRMGQAIETEDAVLKNTLRQIQQYFKSSKMLFELPLNPHGTDFQCRVWLALQAIPAGEVRTYGELAAQLNSSPRAVGNACRQNPIPLIIPCHRVVSASGIGGFAGQLEGKKITIKQQLLRHEGVEI